MNIGIVVYSQTGNTLSVAQGLSDRLSSQGHTVTVDRLETASPAGPGQVVELTRVPNILAYGALVLASPVHAFSLAAPMQQYLADIDHLQGKPVALFVTQHFPFPWMGGMRALGQLRRICQDKGATIMGESIINWSHPRRDQTIQMTIERQANFFLS